MRRLELVCCEQINDFLADVRSTAPAVIAPITQGDTLELAVTKVVPTDPAASIDPFVAKPWSFTEIRFTLGFLDKAPDSGTFKLHVGSSSTGVLTWPTDPTDAAAVSTFKTAIVTAVNAIAGTGAVRLDDPPNTPANFIYLTWTSPTDERVITVVENKLVPAVNSDEIVTNTQPAPAYQQLIKLARLPLISTTTFAFPSNAVPSITREKPGTTGQNEVQIIAINSAAIGAFYLEYSGANTAPLNIQGLTAAQLATSLNALVVDGATNPSFAVTARAASAGTTKFAVSFIGPLAATGQSLLTATAPGQESPTTAIGTLLLTRELFERALNGAASLPVLAELVIVDAGGESTFLRELTLLNDMTGPGTAAAIGILIVPTTVYLDESEADPFITAAAGLSYTVPISAVGASTVNVPHTAWTSYLTGLEVYQQIDDSPETWRECKDTEYGNASSDSTHTLVSFPFNFVNDVTSPYHYAKWKIKLIDPDATVQLAAFKLAWSDCLASLPSGQTLAAKLAAIDAALGVIGGTLNVAAANITGTLSPSQIDAAALATALVGQSTFATALSNLYATNPALVTNLLTQIGDNSSFATTLISAITNNTSITDAVANSLTTNNTFTSTLQSLVLDVIQGTGNLPAGATLYTIPAVSLIVPPPQQIASASITRTVPATEQTTTTAGGTSSILTRTIEVTETTPGVAPRYAALTPQVAGLTDGSGVSGLLPRSGDPTVFLTVSGTAESRSSRGRRGRTFVDGDVIVFTGGYWAKMVEIDGVWYPAELEKILFPELEVDASELYAGSRFSLTAPLFFQMLSAPGSGVTGSITIVAEQRDLATTTYAQIFAQTVHLSAIARLRSFGLTVTHAAGGGLVGAYKVQGQSTAFDPAANSLGIRFRTTKGTIDGTSQPRGSVSITAPKGAILASTVAL